MIYIKVPDDAEGGDSVSGWDNNHVCSMGRIKHNRK